VTPRRGLCYTDEVRIVTIDSPRGAWTYSEWRPAHLAGLVEVVWHSIGTASEPRDRHVPDGTLELLMNLGDPFRLLAPRGAEVFRATWLSGVQSGPVVTEQPRRQSVLGVRLRPAGAYAALGLPLAELAGLVVELPDVVGRAADEFAARCRDAPTVEECFRWAVAWIDQRIARGPRIDPVIARAADEIERSGGGVPIAQLRAETKLSKSRLAAAFREQIGVAPKLYARIVRFRRAAALVRAGAGSLADVALVAGYYDQPHMNAEFREMAGLAPSELAAALGPVVEATERLVEPASLPG
jgi:AraC-like DNA-binding protein